MPALHLPDGYTRESLIPAGDSHPETCITYRPMLATEHSAARADRATSRRGPAGAKRRPGLSLRPWQRTFVSWDLFDDRGSLLEITAESLLAVLDPALFAEIHTTVARFDDEESTAKN